MSGDRSSAAGSDGSVLHLRLRATIDSVPTARHTLINWLRELHVPRPVVDDLALAVTELVTNAVEASPSPASEVKIEAGYTEPDLYVEVCDEGDGFTLDRDRIAHGPASHSIRGRGLPIVQALVDLVSVERHEGCTKVIVTRRLAPFSV